MAKYSRTMPQAQKDKISASLRGRKMSDETKKKIGDKVRQAWASVPKTTGNLWATDDENNDINTNSQND